MSSRHIILACLTGLAALAGFFLLADRDGDDAARPPLLQLSLSKVPLGTSLDEFKRAYRRVLADGHTAPYCSDEHPEGMYVRPSVPGVAHHNCRLHFPEEMVSPDFQPLRMLSFETISPRQSPVGYDLIFRFLPDEDGRSRLWRVEGVFSLGHWSEASTTLEDVLGAQPEEEMGPAGSEGAPPEVVRRIWKRGGATFTLHRYFGDYMTSALVVADDKFEAAFQQRLARTRMSRKPADHGEVDVSR